MTRRAFEPRAFHRHEPDRPAAKDRHRFAAFHLRPINRGVAGRKNVGEEQHFFVAEIARDLARPEVPIRHADELRLPTVVTAVKIGKTEKRAAFLIQ